MEELTGYDGRIMATLRGLLRPGFLTGEYLAGRRAHYLPPLRVYLIVSVIYFVVAAAAPTLGDDDGPAGLKISVNDTTQLTQEERATMQTEIDEAMWWLRPMLKAMLEEPQVFRARLFTVMPRVFFALLPVFAGIVALFYRGRNFPTALVFAVHLHAFAFVVFTITEALKYTRNEHLAERLGAIIGIVFMVYALKAFRAVFGGGWPVTIAKAMAIGLVYMVAAIPSFGVIFLWASWT